MCVLSPAFGLNPRVTFGSPPGSSRFTLQGGGIRIDGSADLIDCNIHDNVATGVSPSAQIEPIACELPQDLVSSAPLN